LSKETVAEFIAASKALRQQLTVKPAADSEFRELQAIKYPRLTKIYCVLIPEDYVWRPKTYDWYEGDELLESNEGWDEWTTVLHGHPVGLICYAPNFCHVFEYSPVGNESPVFLKAFKEKWGV
jgi:hypothetical protein